MMAGLLIRCTRNVAQEASRRVVNHRARLANEIHHRVVITDRAAASTSSKKASSSVIPTLARESCAASTCRHVSASQPPREHIPYRNVQSAAEINGRVSLPMDCDKKYAIYYYGSSRSSTPSCSPSSTFTTTSSPSSSPSSSLLRGLATISADVAASDVAFSTLFPLAVIRSRQNLSPSSSTWKPPLVPNCHGPSCGVEVRAWTRSRVAAVLNEEGLGGWYKKYASGEGRLATVVGRRSGSLIEMQGRRGSGGIGWSREHQGAGGSSTVVVRGGGGCRGERGGGGDRGLRGGGGGEIDVKTGGVRGWRRQFSTSSSDDIRLLQRAKAARQRRAQRAAKGSLSRVGANRGDDVAMIANAAAAGYQGDEGTVIQSPPITQPLIGALAPRNPQEEMLATIFARPDLIITRNIEWANIVVGFEQANRYVIIDPRQPQTAVGYIYEESNVFARQIMRSRRHFVAHVLDAQGKEVLQLRRPPYLIKSSIYIEVDGEVIGEAHGRWHLWKRTYDVYMRKKQFAAVENPGFWNWTFTLTDEDGGVIAAIDRNWRGIGYEFMTDAGQYVVRFGDISQQLHQPGAALEWADKSAQLPPSSTRHLHSALSPGRLFAATESSQPAEARLQKIQESALEVPQLEVVRPLNLLERSVAMGLAVSIDNDYFSRHSGSMGAFPMPFVFGDAAQSEEDPEADETSSRSGGSVDSPGVVGGAAPLAGAAGTQTVAKGTDDSPITDWPEETTLSGEHLPSDDPDVGDHRSGDWGLFGSKESGEGMDVDDGGDSDSSGSLWGTLSDIFGDDGE